MNEERWRRLDALFDAALDLSDSDRRKFLDRECSDDLERRAVARLLALEAEADDFLDAPEVPGRLAAAADSRSGADVEGADEGELTGVRIGPYRLHRLLGRGGMGAVYLAQREDDFRQEVAIKLVRRSLRGSAARQRLRFERQALARLEHPNIARLYDGGTSDDGVPYLVMERVEGLKIDRYCDQHRLSVRQRLELLLPVLAAVAHAHSHLLVHCDIKPSNILVTADGVPKLLDFGIAKLLGHTAEEEIALTLTGQRPLTLSHASPEQVTGGPITTASDIYSLGVLLHGLLCGRLPYAISGEPHSDLARAIVEQDPAPPSRQVLTGPRNSSEPSSSTVAEQRGVGSKDLARQLRGDLDAIVAKAIRKEPARRYRSIEALAADVGCYLEALPVSARRGTWRYRGARLLRRVFWPPDPRRRRERWSWAAALALVLALAWGATALHRPADPCQGAAGRLDGVWDPEVKAAIEKAFLATDLPYAADTWRRVEAILDQRAARWSATRTDVCHATHRRGDLSPRLLDLAQLCLDGRRHELRALTQLFREADRALVIEAINVSGQLSSLEECRDAAELTSLTQPPDDPRIRQRLEKASAVVEEQYLRLRINQPIDLEALRQTAGEIRQLSSPSLLARALYVLGCAESDEGGAPQEGEAHLEEALRTAIAGGDRPQQIRTYAALIKTLAQKQGKVERARFWRDFADATLVAIGPGRDDLEYVMADASGMLEFEAGNGDASKEHYLRALEIAERGSDPIRRIRALNQMGIFGGGYLERALALIERELGPDHVLLSPPLVNLAGHLAYAGRYREALALAQRSMELLRATHGENHPEIAIPQGLIGQLLIALDRPQEAIEPITDALRRLEGALGPEVPLVGEVHVALGEALILAGKLDAAVPHVKRATLILEKALPRSHLARLNLSTVAGDLARESGRIREALSLHLPLLPLVSDVEGSHAKMKSYYAIGQTMLAAGQTDDAVVTLEQALAAAGGSESLATPAGIRFHLARALWSQDRQRALSLLAEARALLSGDLPYHRRIREQIDSWLTPSASPGPATAVTP